VGITVEQKPEFASEPGVALTGANGRVHWLPVRAARAVWVELGPALPAVAAGSGTGGQAGELPTRRRPSGVPGQCRASASGPAHRVTERRTSATAMASSA
jgi:hypothetical protein